MKKIKKDTAYWIGLIFSPPIVAGFAILGYAYQISISKTEFWFWGGMTTLWAIGLPGLWVLGGYLQGKYSDLHLENREDRFWPFFCGIVGTAVAVWILMQSNAPFQYTVLIISALINQIIFTTITMAWKISIHVAVLTAACVAAIYLNGWVAVVSLALIPLVMWARVERQKHTPKQALGGMLVATIVTIAVFYIFGFKPQF